MSQWTEERVDTLKRLWMEGLSATRIAAKLGSGVTRNGVIGKVYRLKLSGRKMPALSRARIPKASSRGPQKAARKVREVPPPTAGHIGPSEPSKLGVPADSDALELHIPPDERIKLLDLTDNTCRWPIGDPVEGKEDFHFCGRENKENSPYCQFHHRRAYYAIKRHSGDRHARAVPGTGRGPHF